MAAVGDGDVEEEEETCLFVACPVCQELLEPYWNICPRCETDVQLSSSVGCHRCKVASPHSSVCAPGGFWCREQLAFQRTAKAPSCCRIASRAWRICPDCKCRLNRPLLAYRASEDDHRQQGLVCTKCPKLKAPSLFHCSTACFLETLQQHHADTTFVHAAEATEHALVDEPAPLLLLPSLQSERGDYPLSSEQIEAYQQNGHIYLPDLLSPEEAEAFLPWLIFTTARKLAADESLAGAGRPKPFKRVHNLWQENTMMQQLVQCQRFAGVAARLLKTERLRLYQDSAFFKEGKDLASPWHQDLAAAPFDSDQFGTLWVTFTAITPEHGALLFAEGSHRTDHRTIGHRPADEGNSLPPRARDGSYHQPSEADLEALGFAISKPAPCMKPGDATFHAGWTFHGAPPNIHETTRYALAISFFADGAKARADRRPIIMDDYPTVSLLFRDNLTPSETVRSKYTPLLLQP